MSYATLLALLAALAFALPFMARLAERLGLARSQGIFVTLALSLVVATYGWLRWRLRYEDSDVVPESDLEPGVLPEEPYIPDFFFHDGVFQGERLIAQGHDDAALKMYEAYRALLKRQGQTTDEVDKMIVHLVAQQGG